MLLRLLNQKKKNNNNKTLENLLINEYLFTCYK